MAFKRMRNRFRRRSRRSFRRPSFARPFRTRRRRSRRTNYRKRNKQVMWGVGILAAAFMLIPAFKLWMETNVFDKVKAAFSKK